MFPKLDGTNGTVWYEAGEVKYGSRNRELKIDGNDNQGFREYISQSKSIKEFFNLYPHHRLYGEWLVPHSLKTYREDAWKEFYIFDVVYDNPDVNEFSYIHYENYSKILNLYKIPYIPVIAIATNPTEEQLIKLLDKNTYLIEDGKGIGEGIVIKNYSYINPFSRVTWAKIVRNEFIELNQKAMGPMKVKGKNINEQLIVEKYLSKAFMEKELNKIINDENGWSNKFIGKLLGTIYHEFVVDHIWKILKENKNPTINFKYLNRFVTEKIKTTLTEVFT